MSELMAKVDAQAKGVIALSFVVKLHSPLEISVFVNETQAYTTKIVCNHCKTNYPCDTIEIIEAGLA